MRIFDSKIPEDIEICLKAPKIYDFLNPKSKQNFEETYETLIKLNVPVVKNHKIVRGLDYYNGVCFEAFIENDRERQQSTILAGGRYDSLTSMFKKESTPAIGFACGVERIMLNLCFEKIHKPKFKIALVPIPPHCQKVNTHILETLKLFEGLCECSIITSFNQLNKKLSFVEKNSYDYAIIVGEDELKNKNFVVKNIKNRTQEIIDQN